MDRTYDYLGDLEHPSSGPDHRWRGKKKRTFLELNEFVLGTKSLTIKTYKKMYLTIKLTSSKPRRHQSQSASETGPADR